MMPWGCAWIGDKWTYAGFPHGGEVGCLEMATTGLWRAMGSSGETARLQGRGNNRTGTAGAGKGQSLCVSCGGAMPKPGGGGMLVY